MTRSICHGVIAAIGIVPATVHSEDASRLIRESGPRPAEEQRSALRAPEGFSVQLFASEPMINKPVNMAFDARGRLWVSSTVEYPFAAAKERWADAQGSRVKQSRDAIKILEDTDGDGRADKASDFADGLNIPTGVLPWHKHGHRAGCIAFSIPNIWYFGDTDGDDRADVREVLFGPLGYEKDTHGMCSSFRLGLDGWVYATHGFNNTSHFKARDGSALDLHSGNVFRFRPEGSRVELWSSGQVNPFGLCWDRYGNLYSADCHSNPVTQLLRGACYPSFGKPHDGLGFAPVMCEHSHGSTGLCGILCIDGGVWGPEWDDHLLVGNCVTSRVNLDRITFSGSTPKANERPDFLTSDDPWFRPVDLQLGPDGALYVADFYNRIIGHYEVPLDHPGRDRERGRIWRVVRNGANPAPCDFTAMSPAQIAAELGNANLTRRHLALGEVKRRGTKEWLPELTRIFFADEAVAARAYTLMGDRAPRDFDTLDRSPSDFHNEGLSCPRADLRSASTLWALAHLGERFAISCVMRDLHTGGGWVEDDRGDEHGSLIESRQHGLLMSHAAQVIGTFERLHPWEKWNLGIVFDSRGSAAGRSAAQALLRRPDFLKDDPSWQRYTVEDLIELLNRLIDPRSGSDLAARHKSDPQFVHALKLLLRDWLGQPNVFTNVMSASRLGREVADADWFVDLLCGVPSADVSRWLMAGFHENRPAALRQIAAHGDEQTVLAAIPRAGRSLGADGLSAMQDGFLQAGRVLPQEFLQACAFAAEELLGGKRQGPTVWQSLPHPDFPGVESPWCLQERQCADGTTVNVLSSLDKDKRAPEQLTGVLRSAPFSAPPKLSFWLCGHLGFPPIPASQKNLVRLVEDAHGVADHSAPLRQAFPPRSDVCQRIEWDLRDIKGKSVRLELVDGDNGRAYAWLGIAGIAPQVAKVESFQSQSVKEKRLRALATILRTTAPVDLRDRLAKYLPAPATPLPKPAPRPELDALIASRVAAFDKSKPDPAKGQILFKSNCAVCHSIKGEGGLVGPQLDGIGSRGAERLAEDILDPSRNVDAHFFLHEIKLRDGSTAVGFVRGEAGQALLLVDAAGKEHRIAKGDIAEDRELPQSPMPPVFGQTLDTQALSDLLGYLLGEKAAQ